VGSAGRGCVFDFEEAIEADDRKVLAVVFGFCFLTLGEVVLGLRLVYLRLVRVPVLSVPELDCLDLEFDVDEFNLDFLLERLVVDDFLEAALPFGFVPGRLILTWLKKSPSSGADPGWAAERYFGIDGESNSDKRLRSVSS